MNRTSEAIAFAIVADWCPMILIRAWTLNVGTEEEFKVITTLNTSFIRLFVVDVGACGCIHVKRLVTNEGSALIEAFFIKILFRIGLGQHTQVVEALEQVETIFTAFAVVVDVNLRVALQTSAVVIDMQVVRLIIHHFLQVVVVGNVYRYRVRVSLTSIICLCIVCQIELVLIPVERFACRRVFLTAEVAFGILRSLEQFPSTTDDLIAIGRNTWHTHRDTSSWKHDIGLLNILNDRNTILERDVNPHYVTLADWVDVLAVFVAFLVVVLIYNGDYLLLSKVVVVGIAAHIQRTCLHWRFTENIKVLLVVHQLSIFRFREKRTNRHR